MPLPDYFPTRCVRQPAGSAGIGGFNVISHTADEGYTVNDEEWEILKNSSRPDDIAETEWNSFWNNLQPSIGSTWGDYVRFSNELIKTYGTALQSQGDQLYNTTEVFRELYLQNPSYKYGGSYQGRLIDTALEVNRDSDTSNDVGVAESLVAIRRLSDKKIVAELKTDNNGNFSTQGLRPDTYEVSLPRTGTSNTEYIFDRGQSYLSPWTSNTNPTFVIAEGINGASSVDAGTVKVRSFNTNNNEIGAKESAPSFAIDGGGKQHIVWLRNGEIWHSYYDGSGWKDAGEIGNLPSDATFSNLKLKTYGSSGLAISFDSQNTAGTALNSYYVAGRSNNSGSFEFSTPVAFTKDTFATSGVDFTISDAGQITAVYTRADKSIKDDTDLYYGSLDINNELIFPSNISVVSPSSLTTTTGGFLKVSLPKVPIIGVEGEAEGFYTVSTKEDRKSPCTYESEIEGESELKAGGGVSGQGGSLYKPDVTLSGFINSTGKNSTKANCGEITRDGEITLSLGAGVELSWPLMTLLAPINLPAAIAADIFLNSIGLNTKVGIEGKFAAGAAAKESNGQWQDFPGTFSGQLNAFASAESKYTGGAIKFSLGVKSKTDFYLGSYDIPSVNFRLGNSEIKGFWELEIKPFAGGLIQKYSGDIGGGSNNVGDTSTVVFSDGYTTIRKTQQFDLNPNDFLGTNNVYFNNNNNSVIGNVIADMTDDRAPVILNDAGGQKTMSWLKTADYNQTQQLGSQVLVSSFVNGQWVSPTAISGSLGQNQDLNLINDSQGHKIAVWSMANTSGINANTTAQQYIDQAEQSDIVYSILDNGIWTSPTSIATIAGGDKNVIVKNDVNGNLLAVWNHRIGDGSYDNALYASTWNGTSWSASSSIVQNVQLWDKPEIGQIDGKTVVFWSQTDGFAVDGGILSSTKATTSLYSSSYNSVTGWSSGVKFVPTFAPVILPSGNSLNGFVEQPALLTESPSNSNGGSGGSGGSGGCTCAVCPECKNNYCPPPLRASDPNDIIGPAGFGAENWINTGTPFDYTIRFENVADATAPAKLVTVTQQLDADLDWRSFRLGSFSWGDIAIQAPENSAFFSDRHRCA